MKHFSIDAPAAKSAGRRTSLKVASVPSGNPLQCGRILRSLILASCLIFTRPASAETLKLTTQDPVLMQALYDNQKRFVSGDIAGDGAIDGNADWEHGDDDRWNIERQRYGADIVQAGVARRDPDVIQQGIDILDWGWKHQASDGSFGKATTGGFHSVTMFVEAAARATLLLKDYDPVKYRDTISSWTTHLSSVGGYLTRSDILDAGHKQDKIFTHRRYLVAAALAETAAVTGDRGLFDVAADWAREGLTLQTPEGINPEKGGFDITYQSFGLLLAYRYLLVCPDSGLRDQVKAMIEKGLPRIEERVDVSGKVIAAGSTRTGVERGEGGTGKVKGIDNRAILQILVYGSMLTGDHEYERAAHDVALKRGWLQ